MTDTNAADNDAAARWQANLRARELLDLVEQQAAFADAESNLDIIPRAKPVTPDRNNIQQKPQKLAAQLASMMGAKMATERLRYEKLICELRLELLEAQGVENRFIRDELASLRRDLIEQREAEVRGILSSHRARGNAVQ